MFRQAVASVRVVFLLRTIVRSVFFRQTAAMNVARRCAGGGALAEPAIRWRILLRPSVVSQWVLHVGEY